MDDQSDFLTILIPVLVVLIIYFISRKAKGNTDASGTDTSVKNRKQNQIPIVTITANNILFDNSMKMDGKTRSALELLSKHACIYIFILVDGFEEMKRIKEEMEKEFEGIVDKEHILYSEKVEGRQSLARQIEPVAHIDFDPEIVHLTSIFIPTVLIAPSSVECKYAKWQSESISDFLTNGNTDFFNSLK